MISNPIIDTMMNRKSIRKFTQQEPTDEMIRTVVRAGQQAPFAYQMSSLLLSRDRAGNPFKAPLYFIVCVDSHRMEAVMAARDWQMANNDLSLLLLGIQDAALMAENMVIAAESLGMGSCFLGGVPYRADKIKKEFQLPGRVFPLVGLAMGYPAEDPPTRPRYPVEFSLFEDRYPRFDLQTVHEAMQVMDDGYLAQDYYRTRNAMISLEGDRQETYTFETYSWTEHISRKTGQWFHEPDQVLEAFRNCGFFIPGHESEDQDD